MYLNYPVDLYRVVRDPHSSRCASVKSTLTLSKGQMFFRLSIFSRRTIPAGYARPNHRFDIAFQSGGVFMRFSLLAIRAIARPAPILEDK